jgi:hypothetical protein
MHVAVVRQNRASSVTSPSALAVSEVVPPRSRQSASEDRLFKNLIAVFSFFKPVVLEGGCGHKRVDGTSSRVLKSSPNKAGRGRGMLVPYLTAPIFPNPPHASFFNGQIAAVSANSPGELPGGILFNIDMVPEDSPVDLNFVAIFQFTAWVEPLGDDGPDSGPIRGVGIRAATTTVPEPSTMLLFSMAAGASGIGWRRRRQAVSSHLVSEPPNARS